MIDKPKNIKVYDLEKNLIGEFFSYNEVVDFTGASYHAIKGAVHRRSCVSRKYYIILDGNINGKISNVCNKCGVSLCEKNSVISEGVLRSKFTCKHCFRNVKYCSYQYEDHKLEMLAKFNAKKDSFKIYYNRHKRKPNQPPKPKEGVCKKCGVTLCDKNRLFSGKTLVKTTCKHCARPITKMCKYKYDNPKLENLSIERSVAINRRIFYNLNTRKKEVHRKGICHKCNVILCDKNNITQYKSDILCKQCLSNSNSCEITYPTKELQLLADQGTLNWKKQLAKKRNANLTDSIIKSRLQALGIPREKVTDELIELKRKQIETIRKLKNQGIWVR
jgi:hypothetical protein